MRSRTIAVAALLAIVVSPLSVSHAQDFAEQYVLDAYGGVHAGGGAPVIAPATPYFGFDVAAAIEYVAVGTNSAVGDGYMVLDKFGGVHYGGALATDPPSGGTPYFGFDAARSITLREAPSRISSAYTDGIGNSPTLFMAPTYFTALSTSITAPTNGFLHVTGTASMWCNQETSFDILAYLNVDVDGTTGAAPQEQGAVTFKDCARAAGHLHQQSAVVSVVVPVTAGAHTVNLLARVIEAPAMQGIVMLNRGVVAEFIAQDSLGQLSLPGTSAVPTVETSVSHDAR